MIIDLNEYDLVKGTPWREELHPRGKDGKFSSIRGGSKVVAKNGTKGKVTQVTDTHYHIEKEDGKTSKILKDNVIHEKDHTELTKKGTKGNGKKTTSKSKKATTGAKRSSSTKSAPGNTKSTPTTKKSSGTKTGTKKASEEAKKKVTAKGATKSAPKKPTTKKTATTATKKGAGTHATNTKGAGRAVSNGSKKAPAKGGAKGKADIRSGAQKNRSLAYDAGEKIGGARKDDFEARFKEKPTLANLDKLEKDNGAVAEKMVTKANLLPKFDFMQEKDNGVDLPTAIMKKLLIDRIAPKPSAKTPEARKAYMASLQKFQRHFEGIKSWDNMKNAIREFSDLARKGERGKASMRSLESYVANPNRYSYFNEEHHMEQAKAGAEAKAMMDFEPLGDKFEGFFTDYKKRESSLNTVAKNMQEGWDKYINPETKKPTKKKDGNKKWERKAEAEHLRTGGKKVTMNKPEELMKNFGVRGVEFGHWVNDASGKYHLQRSAEAFHDLADVIGIDPKDVSLNGRLAIAFGARGKGTALAHYEPDRKVINMTKYGGAGSLAHEWGHAMDNILYQYSHGGKESMGLASDDIGDMGSNDPKLKALYDNVMNAIRQPAPGDKGAYKEIELDSSKSPTSRYYPEMRRQVNEGMAPEDVYAHWQDKVNQQYDRYVNNAKNNSLRSPEDKEKAVKKYERQRSRELNDLTKYLAKELELKQNGGKYYGGEPYKGTLKVPTGNSEYYQRMLETQPGKNQNGSHYWSSGAEMFARVFESYVQHKLDGSKRYNNYLVHGTREGNVKAEGAPFPLGKERTHMFKAMESLLKHVSSKNTLKKALILEVLASGRGDMTEELRKSLGYTKRSAYNVANPEEVIYIPVNRLKVVYQTDQATNWDKVHENFERMEAGENLEPVSIGLDYDIHDGHHRYEASKLANYEHIPCIVKGGNELERQRAIEAYREVWKSIVEDPVAPDAFEDDKAYMYRGIGQRELLYIMKHKHVMTKGKGNDEDKDKATCFSNLYSQAVGYAKSNYDLYNEKQAYVIALPKRNVVEDETGELVARQPVPIEGIQIIPIPKPE